MAWEAVADTDQLGGRHPDLSGAQLALRPAHRRPHRRPGRRPDPVYACTIEDGAIWVDPDQQLNDAAIPHQRNAGQS